MQTSMPGKEGPPYAMIPSYITEFQSSPVKIYNHKIKHGSGLKTHEKCVLWFRLWQNLKDGEERLGEVIEGAAARLVKVELATKELHSEQTEDDDEQEEQQKQGCDRTHRVQQRRHQITERVPVPERGQSALIQSHTPQLTKHTSLTHTW